MAICQVAESSQARMVPTRKVNTPQTRSKLPRNIKPPRARSRLPAQDQGSLCKISSRKYQTSLRKIKTPRAKITAPRTGSRLKATSARSFLSLFIPARARTTSSRPNMASRRAKPHISNDTPATASARRRRPHSSLSYRRFGRHRVSLKAAEANETRPRALRAHAAPKTTNFTARTSPLLLLCRAPIDFLRSPPRCAALLACNGLSVERIARTNDEKDAAWWATTRTRPGAREARAQVGLDDGVYELWRYSETAGRGEWAPRERSSQISRDERHKIPLLLRMASSCIAQS
ncbi:hypothetical protein DFH09DRAFT_1459589 [Mycena vulgaris]|nr:hypothetical protein DFH09DRAFT_1459589 [Mycena vulgaris]